MKILILSGTKLACLVVKGLAHLEGLIGVVNSDGALEVFHFSYLSAFRLLRRSQP